ncbi:hypothetical protein [Burkholderia anthina]|uniref:hypothetical protein n=1 Tax=Burkholderia anthina TaxID=179879 RepID=UPI001E299EFB|nr:hypothetical protein [Burkholderia anthina]
MRATIFNMTGRRGQSRFRPTWARRFAAFSGRSTYRIGRASASVGTSGGNRMLFKRIAIIGSFALTALTSAVAAAGGALEGRMRSAADRGEAGEGRMLLERGARTDGSTALALRLSLP